MNINLILQTVLYFLNICVLLYAFYNFMKKPQNTLEDRVAQVEGKVNDIEVSLKQGNDRFRDQKDTDEVFANCMLAFIDFEIAYCIHTGYEHDKDILRAKETLEKYLAKR